MTIAMMSGALLLSLAAIVLSHLGLSALSLYAKNLISDVDFGNLLMNGMLSFLLFAGAMTIDLPSMKSQKWEVGILASVSTIVSSLSIAWLLYFFLQWINTSIPLIFCLLFGALISPTDPIAVLATFKEIGAPKKITSCVSGESLFNDGVGIVIFTTLFGLAFQHSDITWQNILNIFLRQSVGGILYGMILGYITNFLLKHSNDLKLTILITLMIVTTGYQFALLLNISGALAMVVAGMMAGHYMQNHLNDTMKNSVFNFWELIDEILNAILFLLLGFEILVIHVSGLQLIAMLCIIPLVLLVRMITVATPLRFFLRRSYQRYTISILTWGGLRGGLAVALALSIPKSNYRDFILALTYSVVAFAIIIQGSTIKSLAKLATTKPE